MRYQSARILAEAEVPDWVWVEIAKWRLAGS